MAVEGPDRSGSAGGLPVPSKTTLVPSAAPAAALTSMQTSKRVLMCDLPFLRAGIRLAGGHFNIPSSGSLCSLAELGTRGLALQCFADFRPVPGAGIQRLLQILR